MLTNHTQLPKGAQFLERSTPVAEIIVSRVTAAPPATPVCDAPLFDGLPGSSGLGRSPTTVPLLRGYQGR